MHLGFTWNEAGVLLPELQLGARDRQNPHRLSFTAESPCNKLSPANERSLISDNFNREPGMGR